MKSVVTNRQIFFILLLMITCNSLIHIPKDAINAAGTGAWFSIFLLTAIFSVVIYIFSDLNYRFENKTIFEYSKILLGKPLGYFVSFTYSIYFVVLLIIKFRDIAVFIKEMFMPLTPVWALSFLGLMMTIYIVSKGITNIGRLCEIYGVLLVFVAFSAHTAMFFEGDIKYIEPFFNIKEAGRYIWGMKDLMYHFLGIVILAIIPFNKTINRRGMLYSVLAVILTGFLYIVVIETSVMIVGINDILSYDASLIAALRQTKLPKLFILERADLLFLTVGIAAIIGGLCALYYASTDSLSRLFPRLNRNILLLLIGCIVFLAAVVFIDNELEKLLVAVVTPVFGVFAAFVIPMILFIISKVKKYEN